MRRIDFKERLLECLGGEWPDPGPLDLEIDNPEQKQGYRLSAVRFAASESEMIPALLLIPDGVTSQSPAPAVAIWHQHNGEYHLGKSEPAGLAGNPMHHTGVALAKRGFVVLCPDALCFEDRRDPTGKQKNGAYERFEFLKWTVDGKCLAWKNIWDMKRTIDVLCQLPEVNSEKIGCYGHSMGSTHTWLVGPWEERIKCFVGNCCLPTYRGIHREHLLHCFPNFVPGLHQYGDTPDIAALIAPRPLHLNFGDLDGGSPIEDVRWGIEIIKKAYESIHAEQNYSWFIEEQTGHVLSDRMWDRTKTFFDKHLKS